MKYTYAYKDSCGKRHEESIEADSRDAAFAALRAQGIRPIKVVAADGSVENGSAAPVRRRMWKSTALAVFLVIAAMCLVAYIAVREGNGPDVIMTPQGPVSFSIATPLARQRISGDRERIENIPTNLFAHVGEAFLARYAEPGRSVEQVAIANPDSLFTRDVLKSAIRVASNDLTEYVDLKRIVVGMKREMCAYIEGGGTVRDYLAELAKRQRLEVSYRDQAAKRLEGLIAAHAAAKLGDEVSETEKQDSLALAYDFWLKANAQLQSMGIYPLELPDELRAYQFTLDFNGQ